MRELNIKKENKTLLVKCTVLAYLLTFLYISQTYFSTQGQL